MKYTAGQLRKTFVSALSFVLVALSLALAQGDLIPEAAMKWAVFAIALGNVYAIFKTPNDPKPEPRVLSVGRDTL